MSILKADSRVEAVIYEIRQELAPYLQRLNLEQLSKHNKGYLTYANDPVGCFIDAEMHAHTKIVDFLSKSMPAGAQVIDIGFFIPVIPIALAKLGFQVSSIEKLAFYDHALDEIISFATQTYNIKLYDLDILQDNIDFLSNQFDIVILSAILEHLNGTPRYLLGKAKILGGKDSDYLITVPNVATIRKRLSFLFRGLPPFPSIANYFHSAYPFTGHNREYTLADLEYVLEESEFEITHLEEFNRPAGMSGTSLKERFWSCVARIEPKSMHESLLAVARRR